MKFTLSKKPIFTFKKPSRMMVLNSLRRFCKYGIWFLFLGVVIWLGYIWYVSVYAYNWTEEQKTQYRNEYAGETSFREDRFNHTINVLKERIRLHQTLPVVNKDIFMGAEL